MARPTSSLRRLLGVLAVALCFVLVAPAVAHADVVSAWNTIAQRETLMLRPTAHGQSRGIAMVQGAVYDAVNAIDRGYQPYLIDFDEVAAQPWGSQDAAAATAAHHVLVEIVDPARVGLIDDEYEDTLDGLPDDPMTAERDPGRGGGCSRRCSTPGRTTGTARRSTSPS